MTFPYCPCVDVIITIILYKEESERHPVHMLTEEIVKIYVLCPLLILFIFILGAKDHIICNMLTYFLIAASGPEESFSVRKPLPSILLRTSGNLLRNFPPTTASVQSVGSVVTNGLRRTSSFRSSLY